jgi:hypothetical protein
MDDQEYEAFVSNYLRAREEEQRRELEANASLIEEFTAYASAKGIALSNDCFSYTPITGILATSPGITAKLLEGVEAERDGLYAFKALHDEGKSVAFQPGLLRNDHFILTSVAAITS